MVALLLGLSVHALPTLAADAASSTVSTANFPEPVNLAREVLADGRITVVIGTNRCCGYAIGDSVMVRVAFELIPDSIYRRAYDPSARIAPPSVGRGGASSRRGPIVAERTSQDMLPVPVIETGELQAGDLGQLPNADQAAELQMIDPAVRQDLCVADGERPTLITSNDGMTQCLAAGSKVTVLLTFYLTTYTLKLQVPLQVHFFWAIDKRPDGTPNLQSAWTPQLYIALANLVGENQTQLPEADLSPQTALPAPITPWLLYGCGPLALPLLVMVGYVFWLRFGADKKLTDNVYFWAHVENVLRDAAHRGELTVDHYGHIFHALRVHLDLLGSDASQVLHELERRAEHDLEVVRQVFGWEAKVLFDPGRTGQVMTRQEHRALLEAIAVLVSPAAVALEELLSETGLPAAFAVA
jgi:hypothetical protein